MKDKSQETADPRFALGEVYLTQGAIKALGDYAQQVFTMLSRHRNSDWGDVCDEDKKANDEAVSKGGRILSSYRTQGGVKLLIITEADRSVTTVLLPDEY